MVGGRSPNETLALLAGYRVEKHGSYYSRILWMGSGAGGVASAAALWRALPTRRAGLPLVMGSFAGLGAGFVVSIGVATYDTYRDYGRLGRLETDRRCRIVEEFRAAME